MKSSSNYAHRIDTGHIWKCWRTRFRARSVRTGLKRVDRAMAELEKRLGHPPDEFEIAEELGWRGNVY